MFNDYFLISVSLAIIGFVAGYIIGYTAGSSNSGNESGGGSYQTGMFGM